MKTKDTEVMSLPQHETVGRTFKCGESRWWCCRYVKNQGFWMRHISGTLFYSDSTEDTCISERAVGRTWFRVYTDDTCRDHDTGCECRNCAKDLT